MSEVDLRDRISAPLNCTECRQTVRVGIDRHATGNLTIKCPNCGHEHYRYVENGVITEDRWRSSAQMIPTCYYSTSATDDTCYCSSAASWYIKDAWYSTDTGTANW